MKLLDLVPENETWRVIDSSKLSTYMQCPRKFFFRHVLGWSSSLPNNNLVFGSSWHIAVETLLKLGYSNESLELAKNFFDISYREKLPANTDELFHPKVPANARVALDAYYRYFSESDSRNYKTLHTEVLACTLIGPDMPMYGKLDAILFDMYNKQHVCLDHKTSKYKFSNWGDKWNYEPQMQFYRHILKCLYGDEPQELRIRGAFFYKSKPNEFDEATIEKTDDMIASDITTLRHYYISLMNDLENLIEEGETSEDHMYNFPRNTQSCFAYNQPCPFINVCHSKSNPLNEADREPPMSMHVEFWDPRSPDRMREVWDLTKGNESND